jgi:hypothetical protein
MSLKKVGLVGLLAAFVIAVPASAATVEELQAQVNLLLAQLSALQGGSSTGSASSCYTFTQDLTEGSTGAEVTALQNYLATTGHFSVASTGYFGSITKAAVASWQSANGVAPAAGYWGPISRAKYNSLCTPVSIAPTPGTPVGPGQGHDFYYGDEEGSLEVVKQLSKYSNEKVGEGDEVEVLGVEVKADGADQMIERVNVIIDSPTGSEKDLASYISDVTILLDGEEIGYMDVDDASYNRTAKRYTFRFVGLEGIVEDGDKAELVISVTGARKVSADVAGKGWDIYIPNGGIRASSPNGVTESYDGDAYTKFTAETFASASGVELKVVKSADSPVAGTVKVDKNNATKNVELLRFTMEAKNSPIELFSIPVYFGITGTTSTTTTVSDVTNRVCLVIEGDEYCENVSTPNTEYVNITFDDLDYSISKGDKVEVIVKADIKKPTGNFNEGLGIKAYLDSSLVKAIDAEDKTGKSLKTGDLNGSAQGEYQTLRTAGVFVSAGKHPTPKNIEYNDAVKTDNAGEFQVKFFVEAVDQEVYIKKTSEWKAHDGSPADGVNFVILDGTGAATTTGALVAHLDSGASTSGGYYLVRDGERKEFTLTVTFDPDLSSYYQLLLDSVNYAATATTPNKEVVAVPEEDYRTSAILIEN